MAVERKYELYSQEFRQNAYQVFAHMRRDDPVYRQAGFDGSTPIWFVTRYEDVQSVLNDSRRFALDFRLAMDEERRKEIEASFTELDLLTGTNLLSREGEDHRRLRTLVSKAFTPRVIADLRPRIQVIADALLEEAASRKTMELVESYAFPLPIIVIAELLGIPAADRERFRVWSDVFITPPITPEQQQRAGTLLQEFVDYLRNLFAQRRQEPKNDLISGLLQAESEGECLNTYELFSMVILLIVAGHETTVSLIGNATIALLTHPGLLDHLRANPSEMPQAVEEFLRYDPPVERALTRWVTEDTLLGGMHLKRGDLVIPILGSANRDEAEFTQADQLDLSREHNPHVAFGRGVHYCLGAPLARLEAEIALNTLLRRLPGLRLAVPAESLEYRLVPIFHARTEIPVAWN